MKYEEINLGTKAELTHKITHDDIEKFVALTGDDNKLHVDDNFASKTSFKKPVAHGMLGASFISTVIGTQLPGDGALWFSQTLEFLLPVRVGDEIKVEAEVIKKSDRDKLIDLSINIYNQNRQVVTRGVSKVKIVEQKIPEPKTVQTQVRTKCALILGATGGIGKAVALKLAKNGIDIIIHYNSNKSCALELKKEIEELGRKAQIFNSNIYDNSEVSEVISNSYRKFENIDIFVNCASSSIPPIKPLDLLWGDFESQIDINIKVTHSFIGHLLPKMMENKYGKIITIGSIFTDKPNNNLVHYITAKAALEGYTKSMALELAPYGININMVSPSIIDTNLTSDIPEKIKLITASQTPLRRLATTEDVANAVVFLASDNSSFMSGEIIRVNGGQLMK